MNNLSTKSKLFYLFAATALVCGCTLTGSTKFDQQYGQAEPRERVVESLPANTIDYWDQVKPIVAIRCVVCHGCYDAPCQLKLSSIRNYPALWLP